MPGTLPRPAGGRHGAGPPAAGRARKGGQPRTCFGAEARVSAGARQLHSQAPSCRLLTLAAVAQIALAASGSKRPACRRDRAAIGTSTREAHRLLVARQRCSSLDSHRAAKQPRPQLIGSREDEHGKRHRKHGSLLLCGSAVTVASLSAAPRTLKFKFWSSV